MQLPYVLSIIASTVELTICLVCAHQLLRLRELSGDPSRRLLALGSFLSGALALSVVAANIAMANAKLTTLVLQPWVGTKRLLPAPSDRCLRGGGQNPAMRGDLQLKSSCVQISTEG